MISNRTSISIIILFLLLSLVAFGQVDSTGLTVDTVVYSKNHIYDDSIKTVSLKALNSKYSEPIISIFSGSKLELTFDDLGNEYTDYHYELEHCDKFWQPGIEPMSKFYEGNSSREISDIEFASATKINYAHYRLVIPQDGERFLQSGNYLIHVFDNYNNMVLTSRFMVVNPSISINGEVVRTDDIRTADYRQQIRFEVYDPKSVIQDLGNIYVRISKNASWDITCEGMKPSFVNNDKITFERSDACTFDGGNEYRYFNTLEFKNLSNNIVKVDIQPGASYKLWLDIDKPRSYLLYSSISDFNGKSIYSSDNKSFIPYELDYVNVNFIYKSDVPMFENEIFVYGEMSAYQLDNDFKLIYNAEKEVYSLSKTLKQGLYNYQYVVRSIYSEIPDESLIEGSHFETENDYLILIYYSNIYEGYDELLGMERLNSRKKMDLLYKNK